MRFTWTTKPIAQGHYLAFVEAYRARVDKPTVTRGRNAPAPPPEFPCTFDQYADDLWGFEPEDNQLTLLRSLHGTTYRTLILDFSVNRESERPALDVDVWGDAREIVSDPSGVKSRSVVEP